MSHKTRKKIGVLISNLGTPNEPTPKAVRKYLAQFLWDPSIVQIPRPIWWLILYGFILRSRSKKSAKLYKKIWTERGSPLLALSTDLVNKITANLFARGHHFQVVLGMRYGKPSLKQALTLLKKANVDTVIVLPLYPQYSLTTTASTHAELKKQLKKLSWKPDLQFINHYYKEPSYISAITKSIQTQWQQQIPGQLILFSFHGIPQKLIKRGDPYYDQCLETARKVAEKLNLEDKNWQVVFQSRFGKEKWLQPYCHEFLQSLPKEGYKHIDIICPGFPVDCLETLEEIALTNKQLFHVAGGSSYRYIPALNTADIHVEALTEILLKVYRQA